MVSALNGQLCVFIALLAAGVRRSFVFGMEVIASYTCMLGQGSSSLHPRLLALRPEDIVWKKDQKGDKVLLGEGGFGKVWPASHMHPLHQRKGCICCACLLRLQH